MITGELHPIDMTGAGVTKISRAAYSWVEEMAFDGSKAVTPLTPGRLAGYSGINVGGFIRRMEAFFTFPPCADPTGMSAVLISQAQGLDTVDQIVANCVHMVCTTTNLQVTRFDAGAYTNIAVIPHESPLAMDNATIHSFWAAPLLDSVVVRRPHGGISEIPSLGIGKLGGDNGQFEAYRYTQNGGFPTFHGVNFER